MAKANFRQNQFSISASQPAQATPKWRFWLPLLFQVGLIAAIPAQAFHTLISGRTVVLQTVPVDPYDLLRGYSQTLRYEVSQVEKLKQLPGWNEAVQQIDLGKLPQGTTLYVILEATATSQGANSPQPWEPVGVSLQRPDSLPSNQIALQGTMNRRWIDYGLERYYMPEDKRETINTDIAQTQRGEQAFAVEIKVDGRGKSVPVSLWVSDRNYRF